MVSKSQSSPAPGEIMFVRNHSTWNIGSVSAALDREQALVIATPVLRAIRTVLEIFVANLKIAVGVNPFVSNGEPRLNVPSLLKRGLKLHSPPKIKQIFPSCDNCDIKNGWKQVKKFGQPWLILTVQYLACILTVTVFFFFHRSLIRFRVGEAEINKKASSFYRLR